MHNPATILSSQHAYKLLRPHFNSKVEEFWTVALSVGKEVLDVSMIFRGTVDSCPVHPRDIFRFGCMANASSLIVAHNHPTGALVPSGQDIAITNQLLTLSAALEMPLVDHLIFSSKGYFSFADSGLIKRATHSRLSSLGECRLR